MALLPTARGVNWSEVLPRNTCVDTASCHGPFAQAWVSAAPSAKRVWVISWAQPPGEGGLVRQIHSM